MYLISTFPACIYLLDGRVFDRAGTVLTFCGHPDYSHRPAVLGELFDVDREKRWVGHQLVEFGETTLHEPTDYVRQAAESYLRVCVCVCDIRRTPTPSSLNANDGVLQVWVVHNIIRFYLGQLPHN